MNAKAGSRLLVVGLVHQSLDHRWIIGVVQPVDYRKIVDAGVFAPLLISHDLREVRPLRQVKHDRRTRWKTLPYPKGALGGFCIRPPTRFTRPAGIRGCARCLGSFGPR